MNELLKGINKIREGFEIVGAVLGLILILCSSRKDKFVEYLLDCFGSAL